MAEQCRAMHANGSRCSLASGHGGRHQLPAGHYCHAAGCTTPVPPTLLMCRPHWYMVPAPLRRQVWREYRQGQCDDKRPSLAWCRAADQAVAYVAAAEERAVGLTFEQAFFPTKLPPCSTCGAPAVTVARAAEEMNGGGLITRIAGCDEHPVR